MLKTRPGIEFNIEGNPFEGLIDIARKVLPHQCTLVPDDPGAVTSDHGWDVLRDGRRLRPLIAELKTLGIRVSLFMDPLPDAMASVRELGADRVELYTEPYAQAFGRADEAGAGDEAMLRQRARRSRPASASMRGTISIRRTCRAFSLRCPAYWRFRSVTRWSPTPSRPDSRQRCAAISRRSHEATSA